MATNPELEKSGPSRPAADSIDPDVRPVRLANYHRLVLFAATVYLVFAFIDAITKALLLFLTAFLIAIVLNAPVRWLESRGVKRGVSVAGVALLLAMTLITAGFLAGPPLAREAGQLARTAPERLERLRGKAEAIARQNPMLGSVLQPDALSAEKLAQRASEMLPRVGRYTLGFFGALGAGFFVTIIALYTLGSPKPLLRGLLAAVPPNYRSETTHALTRIVGQLESWALATLLLMGIVGVACGVGLRLIGVPNPMLFGLIAGIGEAIPNIGPLLSALPPMVVALADDPSKALWVAVVFLLVQQVENIFLVPYIMGRSLNLHPVSILFFVLALGAFVGLIGALLAVPAAIITKVIFEEFYAKRQAPKPEALDEAAEQILRAGARPGRMTAPTPAPSAVSDD